MKKYIIFLISIGLLLSTILIFNTINVEEKKKVTFTESGYILNGSTERYYFYEDEKYTTSYDNKIVFLNTEGEKVTIGNDNFIHYSSGNILALQDSVLLDLSKVDEDPIIYYNISANKEIKKTSNRYIVKNLNNDLQFQQAIWKVSSNKYIILGENIKIQLTNGTTKEVKGYIEVEYSDNEVVNVYNQEVSFQTISSESWIELKSDIKINLGTKIVSKDNDNKMSLEDMVINSDDNVTLIDLGTEQEDEEVKEENKIEENTTGSNAGSNSNSSSTSTSTSTSQTTGTIGGTNTNISTNTNTSTNTEGETEEENTIKIETPEIQYDKDENTDDTETEVDLSGTLAEPIFKFENMKITALGIKGNIKIKDDDDLLSKEDDIFIKIINNSTGKTVYNNPVKYGLYDIELDTNILLPNTEYTLIVVGTYIMNETAYTKNFIYKTFMTSQIGIELSPNGFTHEDMNFTISFSDKLIKSIKIKILDKNGDELEGGSDSGDTIENNNETKEYSFTGLEPNTDYIVRISSIHYDGANQAGEEWVLDYKYKTLKTKASIDKLNYSINKRDGKFVLYIEDVKDTEQSIQNYTYVVYEMKEVADEKGNTSLVYDTENIIYQRETTAKEITIDVGASEQTEGIVRDKYYGFKVIANCYDNEKYVEVSSDMCGAFILNGKTFPTVKFVSEKIEPTSITGTLYVTDVENSLEINSNYPLIVKYKNAIGEEETIYTITSKDEYKDVDENGDDALVLPITLDELKTNTSYVISVYGSVNLEDNFDNDTNTEDIYENVFIGSAIVTTGKYSGFTAKFEVIEDPTTTFKVKFSLDGDELSEKSLDSVTILMQAGSDFREEDKYYRYVINNETCKDYDVSNLTELLCEKGIELTPSMIGSGSEKDYKDQYYTIVATITVDGTKYDNEIPIKQIEAPNLEAETGSFHNEDNTTDYSAAFVKVKGKPPTSVPSDTTKVFDVKGITNQEASTEYGELDLYNTELNPSTIVGYKVKAYYTEISNFTPTKVNYYVWDKETNPLEGKVPLFTIESDITNGIIPAAVFALDGTKMQRGKAYRFTFTLEDDSGNVWPTIEDPTKDETSIKSDTVYPNKQEPSFMFYPISSNSNSIKYKYSYLDVDKALEYEDNKAIIEWHRVGKDGTDTTVAKGGLEENEGELDFECTLTNETYKATYTRRLNEYKDDTYKTIELFSQFFEGTITLGAPTYTASYENNRILIKLNDSFYFSRVAGAIVSLSNGQTTIDTNLLKLEQDKEGYYIEVDILDLEGASGFIGAENINVNVTLYYDNGKFGYGTEDYKGEYAAYVDGDLNYMTMNTRGELTQDLNNRINGNAFKYTFDVSDKKVARLTLKDIEENEKTFNLSYSSKGMLYNGNIILQKIMAEQKLTGKKVSIDGVVLGINMEKIEADFTEAKIYAKLHGTENLTINSMCIELQKSEEKIEWGEGNIEEIDIGTDHNNWILNGLEPAKYYKIKFKYKTDENSDWIYTYDTKTLKTGQYYEFETIADIGINNINVIYEPKTYKEKYLEISYNVTEERSTKYYATRYEFYDSNNNLIELDDGNIVDVNDKEYKIEDGKLYVTNDKYNGEPFSSVTEQMNISPSNNKFTFGENYKLKIIPLINITGEDEELIKGIREYEFTLKSLTDPSIIMKALRTDDKIEVNIIITDNNCIMVGENGGEYKISAKRYNDSGEQSVEITDREGNEISEKTTFNIVQNGTNFLVYIPIEEGDYELYNYEISLTYKLDRGNNGNELKEQNKTQTLQKLNESGIYMGDSIYAKQNNDNNKKVDITFENSYNIGKVNRIDYSIMDESTNTVVASGEYSEVLWNQNGNNFYCTLPYEFSNIGSYNITINLYTTDTFIDGKTMSYDYTKNE